MKPLPDVLAKLIEEGYTENYKVGDRGLLSLETEKSYHPDQVHIRNFFRFEGASDPDDNAILYAIETSDGSRGTLTDAYGTYADARTGKFIKEVEDIQKKTTKEEPH